MEGSYQYTIITEGQVLSYVTRTYIVYAKSEQEALAKYIQIMSQTQKEYDVIDDYSEVRFN